MSIQDLYCLAYAPVQGTGLDCLDQDDMSIENVLKEVNYLHKFTHVGFSIFLKHFENEKSTSENKSLNGGIALYCLSSYLSRLQNFCMIAANLASSTINDGYPDISTGMKDLMNSAQAVGIVPSEQSLESYLDTEADAQWDAPPLARGKVGFRQSVSVIKAETEEGSADTTFHTSHVAVKGGDFSRRKARQATGYAKFNFKDLQNESDGETVEDGVSIGDKSYPPSVATTSTKVSEKSAGINTDKKKTKKDENKTTSSKPQNAQKSKTSSATSSSLHPPASKDNKSSSKNNEHSNSSSSSSKLCWGLCGGADSGDDSAAGEPLSRRESSVALGNVEEIQDRDADPKWHEDSRHSERFARIRNRKPTGHPTLLTGTSDELMDLIEHLDSEEANDAKRLLENTQANSATPPSFCNTPTDNSIDRYSTAKDEEGRGGEIAADLFDDCRSLNSDYFENNKNNISNNLYEYPFLDEPDRDYHDIHSSKLVELESPIYMTKLFSGKKNEEKDFLQSNLKNDGSSAYESSSSRF